VDLSPSDELLTSGEILRLVSNSTAPLAC
jgi:hypothetical protein